MPVSTPSFARAVFTSWLWALAGSIALAGPEALQVGESSAGLLPGGKEADGIIGDFLLRNDRVEAVISHHAPLRRANMSTFYGEGNETPGCLYDLTLRGDNNDQLVIFCPWQQKGAVSHVRIVDDGGSGEAIVETVINAAMGKGLYRRLEYRLRDGWQGLMIVSIVRNESGAPIEVPRSDVWHGVGASGTIRGVSWGDAVDPADKGGYAYAPVTYGGIGDVSPPEKTLAPGQEIAQARFLAVGKSPAEAFGIVTAMRGETGLFTGGISERGGGPVDSARALIDFGDEGRLPAYPDSEGAFSFPFPVGKFRVRVEDMGRPAVGAGFQVASGEGGRLQVQMEPASRIEFDVRDAGGRSIPCKAQFLGIEGTPTLNLGPNNRAHGCLDQFHSEKGEFTVAVPPGTYRVVVTRGIEFAHHAETVVLSPGETRKVTAALDRPVDTAGWVSADFHNHSTPSGDNTCGTDDRVINLAAEHIEFAPTTEHNRLYDWAPHIEKLGLSEEISTIPGIELTGRGAHLNAFPFQPQPRRQDGGAPVWNIDPRLNAITLRDFQELNPLRWVQINHPDMVENFIDRNGDGKADGGFTTLGSLINAVETQNFRDSGILAGAPFRLGKAPGGGLGSRVDYIREFIWLQLLNQGHRMWGVAVNDAHRVHGNGVGGWRVYLPSSTDDPGKIDWKELVQNAQAGRMVLTTGPFLEVTAADGTIAGGDTRASGGIDLDIRVQCTDWIDIDRVQILVNGRPLEDLNFTRASHGDWFGDGAVKFDRRITVPLSQDSHLIVVAIGENSDLSIGYGTSDQASIRPCAYNNPIFLDIDGGGFSANGDTLGFDLPVKAISVENARGILQSKGLNGPVNTER